LAWSDFADFIGSCQVITMIPLVGIVLLMSVFYAALACMDKADMKDDPVDRNRRGLHDLPLGPLLRLLHSPGLTCACAAGD
jgi:hypothetical protein